MTSHSATARQSTTSAQTDVAEPCEQRVVGRVDDQRRNDRERETQDHERHEQPRQRDRNEDRAVVRSELGERPEESDHATSGSASLTSMLQRRRVSPLHSYSR